MIELNVEKRAINDVINFIVNDALSVFNTASEGNMKQTIGNVVEERILLT